MASKTELKDKLVLLQTFESNLKIMEFELLEKMQKYRKLYKNNLFNLIQNMKIVENISIRWVNNEGSFFKAETNANLPNLYVLIAPKKMDKFSRALLDKLKEYAEINIKKTDFVVTVGNYINEIASRLDLTIVSHFPISILDNHFSFLDKISSILRVLTVKSLISESHIIYSESALDNSGLLKKRILPITLDGWKKRLDDNEDTKLIDNLNEEFQDIFDKSYEDDVEWFPSILDINTYLIDMTIKIRLDILSNKNKMKFYEREYQLLQSKKEKIKENKEAINLKLNKIRKEEITNDILILASAFKGSDDEEDEEDDLYG